MQQAAHPDLRPDEGRAVIRLNSNLGVLTRPYQLVEAWRLICGQPCSCDNDRNNGFVVNRWPGRRSGARASSVQSIYRYSRAQPHLHFGHRSWDSGSERTIDGRLINSIRRGKPTDWIPSGRDDTVHR